MTIFFYPRAHNCKHTLLKGLKKKNDDFKNQINLIDLLILKMANSKLIKSSLHILQMNR